VSRNIWVEFNDVGPTGLTETLLEWAEPGTDVSVGAVVVAGDDEGNTALGVVAGRTASRVTVHLALSTFTPRDEDRAVS
jgi:hypothetical protein